MPNSTNYNTGYTKEELIHIKSICDKVVDKSDCDPIKFSCTILILHHQGEVCQQPIFRVVTLSGCNVFIDILARVYTEWNQFLENNKLPDCEYCYPLNGMYFTEEQEEFLVGFAYSPASSLFNKAASCLDTAGSVAAVAAAGVFAAGTFLTVTPVALSVAGTTALCTGAYNVTRSVGSLYDRKKHEQSIGLEDQESRSAWMAIGSSAVGMTQMVALKGAQKFVESGKSLGKLSVFGLHALTASSLVFSGFGFVENLFICADKYNQGNLTKKDVFDLSCELLFLFNAIASAKATSQLVNNMNLVVSEAPSSQKKLTKTQKRNLRRRAAKRRARGLPANVAEESNRFPAVGISATLNLLLLEAVKAYSPRLQEILYTCQSIGHDVMCWRANEMPGLVLIKNLGKNCKKLYDSYKCEINEAAAKIADFFCSVIDGVLRFIYLLFETASEEVRSIFCTKVINLEDEISHLIDEAEGEIASIHDDLHIDYNPVTFDSFDDDESLEGFSTETQSILRGCNELMDATPLSCNDIEEFGDILDALKFVVVSDFKLRMDNYEKSLKAAKAAAGDSFNIQLFKESLEIRGEVSQHLFNETLKTVTASETIYKLKSKLKDIKKNETSSTTPVWKALTEGLFQYHGPHGAGVLSKHDLVSVVNTILVNNGGIRLCNENCSIVSEDHHTDVVMISIKENPDLNIVVYHGLTEENTACGIIMIVK